MIMFCLCPILFKTERDSGSNVTRPSERGHDSSAGPAGSQPVYPSLGDISAFQLSIDSVCVCVCVWVCVCVCVSAGSRDPGADSS